MAAPLTRLLKKEGFNWIEADRAIEELKQAMQAVPTLALPNFEKNFVTEADASEFGVGAVLSQEGQPIAYFSQALSECAHQKSVYEREHISIVLAVQKWCHYLLFFGGGGVGWYFLVHSNQHSVKYLLDQRELAPEYQKWLAKLMAFVLKFSTSPDTQTQM